MPTKLIYPVMDQRGNVVALTDENGAITARREYNAFGEIISESGDWSDFRMGFQSNWMELKDAEPPQYATPSGRVYCPEIGRFLQKDPFGRPGRNPYAYAKNNPLQFVDPSGLTACPCQCKEGMKDLKDVINDQVNKLIAAAGETHRSFSIVSCPRPGFGGI